MPNQPDSIQQYLNAVTALRRAIYEAHEATKDLKAAVKEAKDIRSKLPSIATRQVEQSVEQGLKEYHDTLSKAIETAEAAIFRRFDKVQAILLGDEDKEKGGKDLEDQVRRVMATLSPGDRQVMYSWAQLVLRSP